MPVIEMVGEDTRLRTAAAIVAATAMEDSADKASVGDDVDSDLDTASRISRCKNVYSSSVPNRLKLGPKFTL
jgi:hypothetical protein